MPPDSFHQQESSLASVGSPGFGFLTTEPSRCGLPGPQGESGEGEGEDRRVALSTSFPGEKSPSLSQQTCQLDPAGLVDRIWDSCWTGNGPCDLTPSQFSEVESYTRLSLRHGVTESAVGRHVKHLRSCLLHAIGKDEAGWSLMSPFGRRQAPKWKRVTPRLSDCFAVVASLGEGECGVVRLCEEMETGQQFACKTIYKASVQTEDAIHEVCSEILTLLQLGPTKSKHLVNLQEVFDEEDAVHLIVDFCNGGDLLEHINKQGTLTEGQAAHILKQAVRGAMAMHSKGIVHRDLKPENILLCKSEAGPPRVRVADFGLSVELQGAMKAQGTAGSLHYMAPEVAASRCYGRKVDVWSLGVVLYVCLSGKLPFEGKSEEAVRKAICKAKPCLKQKPWSNVSPEAKHLLLWMLHPKREERMPLAEVLAHPWFQMYAPDDN